MCGPASDLRRNTLAIKRALAEPDPARLAWRDLIKETIRDVVTQPGQDALVRHSPGCPGQCAEAERGSVQALIVEELRRLHEGVLARYGLRPSEFTA
ncbi:hypothetical protein ACU4GD_16900 [Cupriavidus basilensis]